MTFTNESGSGWQQGNFSTPVSVVAGTTYVVSYYAPNGHYSYNSNFFASAGVDNPPVHALANGGSGGDGVYNYASASTFPSSIYGAANIGWTWFISRATRPLLLRYPEHCQPMAVQAEMSVAQFRLRLTSL